MAGTGQLLRGMEMAVLGRCAGEKISLRIPADLAFDDPGKDFPWRGDAQAPRPAPDGSSTRYEISVVQVEEAPPPSSPGASLVQFAYHGTNLYFSGAYFAYLAWLGVQVQFAYLACDEHGVIHMPLG
ncbi:unnamed protein product [Polarella glacialis]|uniref:peptidylprolyl isomerase n=1 Tax=Polarella glacialis TaxID=89957 RepID=A0A813LCI7_POLGL|nr:unnamed protein product [Polarella glacialis]CAE8722461.1 unnamed protein product [Polarella glacialis]